MSVGSDSHELDAVVQTWASPETYEPNDEEQQLLADLDENFRVDSDARSSYSIDWDFYLRYIKGDQLIVRNSETGDVVRIIGDDAKRLRSMMNIMRPSARSLIGKMTRNVPTCEVIPATADFEEQHGSRVATALLKHARRTQKLDLKFIEAIECLPWAGNGFWYLEWDRFAGDRKMWCPVCGYESANDMEQGPCPQCSYQRQAEEQAQAVAMQMAEQQEMMSTVGMLPEGTQPEQAMIPMDAVPPQPQQMGPLPLGAAIPNLEEVFTGAPKVSALDPRFVYPEAGSTSLDMANRVTIRYPVPIPTLRQTFPEFAAFIKPDDELVHDESVLYDQGMFGHETLHSLLENHALLTVVIHKPTMRHPHGRIIYRVGNIIVRQLGIDLEAPEGTEQEDNPVYILGRFPLYHVGFDHNTGEFWYEPPASNAWHRQRELNRNETAIRENIELGLKPKALVPINSMITSDEITSASPQIIKYNPVAGDIKPFMFPAMPQQVFERGNVLTSDIRGQFTITDQEAGQTTSDPNGRAMAIMEAEADQQLGPFMVRIHSEWAELHRGYLQLMQKYGDAKTKFTVPGVDTIETYYFDELVLKSGWDIQIEQADGMSKNRAVRFREALELLNAGVFTDQASGAVDIRAFMRHAKLNLPQAGYDLDATEVAAASQIPVKLQQGMQHIPQLEDDPERFGSVLLGWLRGPGRRMVDQNPQLVMQVRALFQFYSTWALTGAMPGVAQPGQQTAPGAGPGGLDMTAQGGTPNGEGGLGSDIRTEARGTVSEADKAAEGAAAVQQKREG